MSTQQQQQHYTTQPTLKRPTLRFLYLTFHTFIHALPRELFTRHFGFQGVSQWYHSGNWYHIACDPYILTCMYHVHTNGISSHCANQEAPLSLTTIKQGFPRYPVEYWFLSRHYLSQHTSPLHNGYRDDSGLLQGGPLPEDYTPHFVNHVGSQSGVWIGAHIQ